ncbi:MAG: hypothetical protein OEV42_10290 [Deltaproteobacteria bacterium]|nr:hypothetical protein [Deltaproteobacteria bacterium]
MGKQAFVYAKRSDAKSSASVSNSTKKTFECTVNKPYDKIMNLQRSVGNQAVGRLLGSGKPNDNYEKEVDRSADMIMRRGGPETQINSFKDRGWPLSKVEQSGTLQAGFPHGHAISLLCALTHPIGIDSTSSKNFLSYGAKFTHKLKISKGGTAQCLKGTLITEKLTIDRDDFKFNNTSVGKSVWVLGVKGSKKPDQFTDHIETPHNLVLKAMEKNKPRLPAKRNETQHFYWRRHKYDKWQRFATVKIHFMVDKFRNNLFTWTIDNSVVVAEKWAYRRPRGY